MKKTKQQIFADKLMAVIDSVTEFDQTPADIELWIKIKKIRGIL